MMCQHESQLGLKRSTLPAVLNRLAVLALRLCTDLYGFCV